MLDQLAARRLEAERLAADHERQAVSLRASWRAEVARAVDATSVARVATELGVSRQRVYQLLEEHGRRVAAIRVRLEEIDARWDALVDAVAAQYVPGEANGVTAYRNGQAAKRRRKGLGPLPTVRSEVRGLAESELLRLLDDRVGDARIDAIRREVDEAAALAKELESLEKSGGGVF